MCNKLVIYKDCSKMHGQQNIKNTILQFMRAIFYNVPTFLHYYLAISSQMTSNFL